MKENNKTTSYKKLAWIGIIIALFVGLFIWYKATPGKYDHLAACLTEKKVTFYGAFWCPHCQATKQAFGKSVQYLNYVECSEKTPNAEGGYDQTALCKEKKIESYPTWEFADGSRLTGEIPMEQLAQKASCSL